MDFVLSEKLADFMWMNGRIIPWDDGYIHAMTHSLHYGGAVFEGERAYSGKVFKLNQHTNRLLRSAKDMHLSVKYSDKEINDATNQLLKKNNLRNAYIRPLIWRSSKSLGIYSTSLDSNLLIIAYKSNPEFKNGLKLLLSPWRKFSENAIPVQSKSSAHYAMTFVSKKLAQDKGYDDALLLDQHDCIAECSTTNIFFGKGDTIVTPIADRFLNGITRQTVIEIAKTIGIKVYEARINLEDIKEYDSCFATGTAAEIKGIKLIDAGSQSITFTNDVITSKLQKKYAEIVEKEL